ncbi:elongation factor P [Altererythrobacter aquiaggeris]|uniref:elongation factor P n=1 Tax=Aestuarierythrobacter aquiaggeris TaxID=1898396 RepID=UPI00301A213D
MIGKSILTLAAIAALTGPVTAGSGDTLATLPRGSYGCELPGNAAGPAGIPVDEMSFKIENASSYNSARGSGTYLLTGRTVRMTSGPLRGLKFDRVGRTMLREITEDGTPGRMRCVLYGR